MKKTKMMAVLLILTIGLAACSGTSTQTTSDAGTSQGQTAGGGNRPISPQMQLAVGTFKLEGTSNAVDAKEAAQLTPLWQLYKQLSTSSSSAPQELTAAVDQIKSTMTTDQITAITAMKLTNRDAFTFLQEKGIIQPGGFNFSGTPDANRTPRPGGNGFGGGGFPGGGFPGGGGGPAGGNGQNFTPNQIATFQARRAQGGGGGFRNRLPPGVVDALITLLQSKAGPLPTSTLIVTATESAAPISTDTPTVTPTP